MSTCSTFTSSRYIHALVVSLVVSPSCMSENETPVCTITAPWQYEFCPTQLDANSSLIIRVIDWPTEEIHIIGKEVENVIQYILDVDVDVRRIYSEGFDVVVGVASESAELHGVDFVQVSTPDLTVFPRDGLRDGDECLDFPVMQLNVTGEAQRISIQGDRDLECFGVDIGGIRGHVVANEYVPPTWANLTLDVAAAVQPSSILGLQAPVGASLAQLQELGHRAKLIQVSLVEDGLLNEYLTWLAAMAYSGVVENCFEGACTAIETSAADFGGPL